MENETGINTEDILRGRRARFRFEIPPDALATITLPAANQIREAAWRRFDKACDAGIWKRLARVVLEPANPLEANAPRRIRQEAIVLGSLIGLAVALALFFNVYARVR
jgi:hypothetical protein